MTKTLYTLLALLMLAGITEQSIAQQFEPVEIPYYTPPAIAARNAIEESPAKVLVGHRDGRIQFFNFELGTLSQDKVLTPGQELPADVESIFAIAIPQPNLIVALASYVEGDVSYYGILRSEDFGDTWEFIKPEELKTDHLDVNKGTVGGRTFTGNYYRATLYEMEWLADGEHGWIWGRNGIVRTTDAGETWEVVYQADVQDNLGINNNQIIWAVSFHDATNGAAAIGIAANTTFRTTTDGGRTWEQKGIAQSRRIADLSTYTIDEATYGYRAVGYRRDQKTRNTALFRSTNNGTTWGPLGAAGTAAIASEQGPMSEILWANPNVGFMVIRQGEIWKTENGGQNWAQFQVEDESYDTVYWGDGSSINGQGPPNYPYAGYGQRSVFVCDDAGDLYIAQALTDTHEGTIRSYIPTWLVGDKTLAAPGRSSRPVAFEVSVAPNPTGSTGRIRFVLDSPERVSVSVVDALGRSVRTADLGTMLAGENAAAIDLDDLQSGTYTVIVRAGDARGVNRLTIVR